MDKPQSMDPEEGPSLASHEGVHSKQRRARQPKLEKDIFGNEYLGTKAVFNLTLDGDLLSEGAKKLLSVASALQMTSSNLAQVFSEALLSVEDGFWQKKIEVLTPFEWRLNEALKDKEFRKVVEDFLDGSRP